MPLDFINDHVAQANARIIEQYKGLPNIKGIIDIHAGRIQELERIIYPFVSIVDLPNAVGDQLDIVGGMVGVSRGLNDDATYKALIVIQIAISLSRGRIVDVIPIAKSLSSADKVLYNPDFPGKYFLTVINATPLIPINQIRDVLEDISSAGVGFTFISAPLNYFGFNGDPDALGFDNGEFAGIIP